MMRRLLLVLLAPFWWPRWLLHWALWRRSKRATLHVVLRGSLPDLAASRGLLGLLRPASGPELISLLEGLVAAAASTTAVELSATRRPTRCRGLAPPRRQG
jgi:hypothetical protein